MDNLYKKMSDEALAALTVLNNCGYKAYIVGGAVRDAMLNKTPHDFDICTSAEPHEILECFKDVECQMIGGRCGTVSVILHSNQVAPLEITPFRTEGNYTDGRHPESITFVKDVVKDLERRDFTINAMAYNPNEGVIDPFGGVHDLSHKIIRCVDTPQITFKEDYLRILRAVVLQAKTGFTLSFDTRIAMTVYAPNVILLPYERIGTELVKLLSVDDADAVHAALVFNDVTIARSIAEFAPCLGFEQNHPYHALDVYHHSMAAVKGVISLKGDFTTRLAALFHDVGKPFTKTTDSDGIDHFYGHADTSEIIARKALEKYCIPMKTINDVCQLILCHDAIMGIPTKKHIRKLLSVMGEDQVRRLFILRRADCLAQSEKAINNLLGMDEADILLQEIIDAGECFSLKNLELTGKDLLNTGFSEGPTIGKILNELLTLVIEGKLKNERRVLLEEAFVLGYRK